LDSLPTGSLTTWEQVRSAFLSNSKFKQTHDEPFYYSWERFNNYRRECPHHGFENDYLLGVFYDGVGLEAQNQLDSSSNGDFMTQTTERAFALIENMASSSANKNPETDRFMALTRKK